MSIKALREFAERNQIATVREVKAALAEVAELEARLAAIDAALDDADAPDATEAHALDNDPIIERIKLWRHVDSEISARLADARHEIDNTIQRANAAEARLAEAEAALIETIEDATEGVEKHIRRAEAAEARAEAKDKEWVVAYHKWHKAEARAEVTEKEVEKLRNILGDAGLLIADGRYRTANEIIRAALRPDEHPAAVPGDCPKCGAPLGYVAHVEQTGETRQEVVVDEIVCRVCDLDEQHAKSEGKNETT